MKRRQSRGRRFWTPREVRSLRALYPHVSTAEAARILGRSVESVNGAAGLFGVRKTPDYLASPMACRLRRGSEHPGKATQFTKGHVPMNKGTHRPGWYRGRMRMAWFKRGNKPQTWVPVGTEVADPDGYRKRKVSDDRTKPSRFNWKFVSVLVWERAHGPVPPGHAVVFKNGDRADIRLENLELLSRRQLMARNSIQNLPTILRDTIQLRGQLQRRIREATP